MNSEIPIFFFILGIFFFLLALYEEKQYDADNDVDDDEKDNFTTILFVFATLFLFLAGVCTMYITEMYYSPSTDSIVETIPTSTNRYLGFVPIGLGMFSFILLVVKIMDILGKKWTEENGG